MGVSRDCPFFGYPLLSQEWVLKATDFKFGRYIYRASPNKSLLKILETRERGCVQGLPKLFWVPHIIILLI